MKKIDISQLDDHILKHPVLIVGSPKGVGFSTYISEIIAHQLFFNEKYTILVLTKNRKSKINMLFKIKAAYLFFGVSLLQDDNVLYQKGEKGSGVCVINYDEYKLETIDEKYDMIIVDSDDCSDYLYSFLKIFMDSATHLIFNTYDLPHSIWYNINLPKIKITSEFSRKSIELLWNKHPNIINYDRILEGLFLE